MPKRRSCRCGIEDRRHITATGCSGAGLRRPDVQFEWRLRRRWTSAKGGKSRQHAVPRGGELITFRTAGAGWRRVAWRGLTAAITPALLGGLVAACGTRASAPGQGPITVYSGQHEQTTQSLIDAFEKQTGIQVNVRYDDEDTFTDEIVSEEAHPRADIFYTENSPPLEYLQEKGLLAHVDAATLAKTPSQYNSPDGDWLGISARVSVLIYNPSLIGASKLPETVLQLASPAYRASSPSPQERPTSSRSSPRWHTPTARPRHLPGCRASR
jgi:hypothetical protein